MVDYPRRNFSGSIRDFDEYVVAFNGNLEWLLADRGRQAMSPCVDVVLPAVPRAGDNASVERSFSDRTAGVCADSVNRPDVFIDLEQSDDSPAGCDFQTGVRRDFVQGGDSVFFRHGVRNFSVRGVQILHSSE
jgi:hypothetical protein